MTRPIPSTALLLTACIAPGDAAARHIVRVDPRVRMNDYAASLSRWLRLKCPAIDTIVFADASGHPLDFLEPVIREHNVFGRTVELLSMNDNVIPEDMHYGYAELGIMDHAIEHSRLSKFTRFVKATGRLFFPDLPRLLDRLPDNLLVAVDARSQPFFLFRKRVPFVTTQLLIFDRDFYCSVMKGRRREMGPETGITYVENLLFSALVPLKGTPGVLLRFPVNAEPVGINAHKGKNYRGAGPWARSLIRAAGRRLAPNVWI